MSARALMILGTASHVGKSILTAALGRILADEGYRVVPFKAQNMSLNSAATPDGREIGRAQALQAEACRVTPQVEMNPVLIKPSSDCAAQVVVMGRVWGQISASDYHLRRVEELFPIVVEAYHSLASEHDVIVMEGAGSPAEINLKGRDIVNLRMARAAGASCLLVGDIDRGGVFASLLGTVELLDPEERAMIRGFVINKFRGDIDLLRPGIEMIERRIGLPCAGVVPHLSNLGLDEEDSVSLEETRGARQAWSVREEGPLRRMRVGVVKFPYLSNFTDFDELAAEPSVSLAFLDTPEQLHEANLLILPGSKQTLDDLDWLRHRGFEPALAQFAGRAGIMGICGGMQMLGLSIEDAQGVESDGIARAVTGLGLLPIRTALHAQKVTRLARGHVCASSLFGEDLSLARFQGYEIHLGETVYVEGAQPFARIHRAGDSSDRLDGALCAERRAYGTYIHGIFKEDGFRHRFLSAARAMCGFAPAKRTVCATAEREQRIDRLAAHVRGALDMNLIHACLGLDRESAHRPDSACVKGL
jgi:adenosylcobyric acid synthase